MGSTTRPYWAYSGFVLNPILTLPGDHPGPGAMNVYDSVIVLGGWPYFAGERRVVWHYYSDGTRYVRNARFSETPYGFIVH